MRAKREQGARATVAVIVAACWAAACGSSTTVIEGHGGGTSSSGSGGSTSSSSTSSSGTSSSTSGSACDDFQKPADLGEPVDVRIENHTDADLFLGDPSAGCGPPKLFSLFEDGGDPPALYDGQLDLCEFTCGYLQSGDCACTAGCAAPIAVRIVPGGAYVVTWGGYVFEHVEMPAACYYSPGCASLCALETKAPSSLVVRAQAYDEVSCGGNECSCTPDASGSCLITEMPTVGGELVSGSGTWHAGEKQVTVGVGP
jgi:hypothetical protein